MLNNLDKVIILYDGHCPLCHYWIRYAIDNDKKDKLYYAPIQGDFGSNFISENNLKSFDTVIFHLPNTPPHLYSKAVFEILKYLEIKNIIYYFLKISPNVLSNILYRIVAKTRYLVFKRFDECEIPNKEILSRIIL
tara:strand:- start:8940 stop:9347 length:408 start_codon:yes stop_codon:yes gene_type:complete